MSSNTQRDATAGAHCNLAYSAAGSVSNLAQMAKNEHESNDTYPQAAAPSPPAAAPTDIIGEIVGDFGIWQLRTILIIFLCKIPAAWFMACIIFTAPELYPRSEFQCDRSFLLQNQSITPDQCHVLEHKNTGIDVMQKREPCTHFIYNADFQSLIMQFDLVCLRDIFVAWTQYWHLFGVLAGGVLGTKMMLISSPKTVYFVGMWVQIGCGVVTGYARDFSLHCAFRCMSAVGCAIMFTSGQAIFADITSGIYRIGAIILYDTFWSIGVILLPSLAAFFDNWTFIYLGITFPTFLLMLLLLWTPESPRWLLKNGSDADVAHVEQLIRQAAHINDRACKIPPNFTEQLMSLRKKLLAQPAPASWRQLWQGVARAKTHMIAVHLALACFIINFMGMLLNIRSFGRDYLVPNTIAMGFSEIIGCFLALHFALKCNHWKWQWAGGFNILAGLLGCTGWFFSAAKMDDTLKVTLWMIIATIPKAGVSCAQSMILACMNELMPANKKVPFVFSVVTWARVWLLSAPFLNVLKKFDVALSLTSYCVLSIIGGFFTCLLFTPAAQNVAPALAVKDEEQANGEAIFKDGSSMEMPIWTVGVNGDTNCTRL